MVLIMNEVTKAVKLQLMTEKQEVELDAQYTKTSNEDAKNFMGAAPLPSIQIIPRY